MDIMDISTMYYNKHFVLSLFYERYLLSLVLNIVYFIVLMFSVGTTDGHELFAKSGAPIFLFITMCVHTVLYKLN